jgi:2-keto-4-pentenoate hydratase/2-oxohepta-3-ene-1,7-dioic acid hydratase in catechol pathway
MRQGRGGFPKTMLELVAGGAEALAAACEALEHGAALGKFLKAGDRIEAEVEKIGVLANRVVAP